MLIMLPSVSVRFDFQAMTFGAVKNSRVLLFLEHFHKHGIASSMHAGRMLIELWAVAWINWVASDTTTHSTITGEDPSWHTQQLPM